MSDELLDAMGALPFVAELERLVSERVMATAGDDGRLQLLPALDVQRLISLACRATVVVASDLQRSHAAVEEEALERALALPMWPTQEAATVAALESGGVAIGPWADGCWRVIPPAEMDTDAVSIAMTRAGVDAIKGGRVLDLLEGGRS